MSFTIGRRCLWWVIKQVLTKNILPELIERKKEKEIKIWSAGCATGEEPHSIAMAIMASTLSGGFNATVYATDICKEALERAKEGVYNLFPDKHQQ